MRFLPALSLLFFTASLCGLAPAAAEKSEKPSPEQIEAAMVERAHRILGNLKYKEGTIQLPTGIAHLELPAGYRYLDGSDARKVVVDYWGNPPDQGSNLLGLVVPAGEDLADPNSWAVVINFEEDGYVSDKDAGKIDYNDLLSQLQENTREANKQRQAQGYEPMELKGWAVPPRYDQEKKVMYWAQDLKVAGEDDTLNYYVRVLGRRGVLSMNGVAGMDRVKDVEAATPAIVAMTQYNEGHRYADFNSSTDKKADYTLAGLLLGGLVASKLGLFAKLGTLLLAFKKFVIIGAVAVAGFFKRLFGRKSQA